MTGAFAKALGDRNVTVLVLLAAVSRVTVSSLAILGLPIRPNWFPGPTLWGDFSAYLADLAYLVHGYIPYRDFAFSYGPLYLYSMAPLYEISPYLAVVPTLVSDILTVLLIYFLVKKTARSRLAFVAGLGYALSPFVLINESYIWMSSQPMTFFMVLSLYFMRDRRPLEASLSLAVAALFKQEALFILPVILFGYWRQQGWRMQRGILAGAGTYIAGVSPFLVVAPRAIIYSLTYGKFFNIGPIEPSRLPSGPTGQVLSNSSSAAVCHQITLPGAYTGRFCGQLVNTQQFLLYLGEARVERFLFVLEPFLLVLFVIAIFAIRKSPVLLEISSAMAVLVALFIFSVEVHGAYAYYFLPVYAILLAAATDKGTVCVSILAVFAAAFVPEGQFQMLLPTVAVFVIIVLESARMERAERMGGPTMVTGTIPEPRARRCVRSLGSSVSCRPHGEWRFLIARRLYPSG